MGDFFRGWRRKTGMVTQAMACVFMAAWVRSGSIEDDLGSSVYSRNGAIECVTYQSSATLLVVHVDENGRQFVSTEAGTVSQNGPSVAFASAPPQPSSVITETIPWSVPYWSIVAPSHCSPGTCCSQKPRGAKTPGTRPDRPSTV